MAYKKLHLLKYSHERQEIWNVVIKKMFFGLLV